MTTNFRTSSIEVAELPIDEKQQRIETIAKFVDELKIGKHDSYIDTVFFL